MGKAEGWKFYTLTPLSLLTLYPWIFFYVRWGKNWLLCGSIIGWTGLKVLVNALIPGWWPIISGWYPGSIPGYLFFNTLINNLDDHVELTTNKLTDDTKLGEWLTQEIIELQSVVHLRTELAETSWSSTKMCEVLHLKEEKKKINMALELTGPVVRLDMSQQLLFLWGEYVKYSPSLWTRQIVSIRSIVASTLGEVMFPST